MKVSIVTPSYNSARTIEDTIQSVLGQTYPNIEYIIVDGGSTDGTQEIVKKYGEKVTKFVSERDKGIFDGMNKGVHMATGDIVGILNSDDFYKDSSVIQVVVDAFQKSDAQAVWGDIDIVDFEDTAKMVRVWKSSSYEPGKFMRGWHPPHPAFFVKKALYEKYGDFRLDMPIASDYELMLRFLGRHRARGHYVSKTFVAMRSGGNSTRGLLSILKSNIEAYRAFKINGLSVSPMIILRKPISKVRQVRGGLWRKHKKKSS